MSWSLRVARNTLAQIIGKVGIVLITVIVTSLLTRTLGTEGYGNYTFIISFILFFVSIGDWGTGLISVREGVKNENLPRFIGNVFLFRLGLTAIAFFLMSFVVLFTPFFGNLANLIILSTFLLLLISWKTSCSIIFQIKQCFEYLSLTDFIISLTFLLFLLASLFLKSNFDLRTVLVFFILANFFGGLFSFVFNLKMTKFDFHPDIKILKSILTECLPTGALLLTFAIYNRLDIFLLQFMKGPDPVGVYGLAYKVHDNLVLGAAYLTSALFPVLSNLIHKGEFKEVEKIYKKVFDILFVSAFGVLISVFLLAPFIISIIGGPLFTNSAIALRILVFATFFAYFNHLTGYTLIALGKQKVSFFVALFALIWNISLNWFLIPHFSFIASAVVTVLTEGLVLFFTSYFLLRKYNLSPSLSFFHTSKQLIINKGKIF